MVKRVLAGLLAAAAIGTLGAQAAMAAAPGNGDPGVRGPGDCVWIWTNGPPECRKLE